MHLSRKNEFPRLQTKKYIRLAFLFSFHVLETVIYKAELHFNQLILPLKNCVLVEKLSAVLSCLHN